MKYSWGKIKEILLFLPLKFRLFDNISQVKIFIGENFCHPTKISSLFLCEIFSERVNNEVTYLIIAAKVIKFDE